MIRQITRDELLRLRSTGEKFSLVDVLSRESYAGEHIPGALSIPLEFLEKKAGQLLRKDDTIVVYCGGFECKASTIAAAKLLGLGFTHVLDYKGGLKDYKAGGFALEGSLHGEKSCALCCSCD